MVELQVFTTSDNLQTIIALIYIKFQNRKENWKKTMPFFWIQEKNLNTWPILLGSNLTNGYEL